jgi:hypothetical protein
LFDIAIGTVRVLTSFVPDLIWLTWEAVVSSTCLALLLHLSMHAIFDSLSHPLLSPCAPAQHRTWVRAGMVTDRWN